MKKLLFIIGLVLLASQLQAGSWIHYDTLPVDSGTPGCQVMAFYDAYDSGPDHDEIPYPPTVTCFENFGAITQIGLSLRHRWDQIEDSTFGDARLRVWVSRSRKYDPDSIQTMVNFVIDSMWNPNGGQGDWTYTDTVWLNLPKGNYSFMTDGYDCTYPNCTLEYKGNVDIELDRIFIEHGTPFDTILRPVMDSTYTDWSDSGTTGDSNYQEVDEVTKDYDSTHIYFNGAIIGDDGNDSYFLTEWDTAGIYEPWYIDIHTWVKQTAGWTGIGSAEVQYRHFFRYNANNRHEWNDTITMADSIHWWEGESRFNGVMETPSPLGMEWPIEAFSSTGLRMEAGINLTKSYMSCKTRVTQLYGQLYYDSIYSQYSGYFGYKSIGVKNEQLNQSYGLMGRNDTVNTYTYHAGSHQFVDSVYVYMKSYSAGDFTVDAAIYMMDRSTGRPTTRLGNAVTVTGNGGTAQWYSAFVDSISLSIGSTYCICIGNPTNGVRIYYDSLLTPAATQYTASRQTSTTLGATWTHNANGWATISAYFHYAETSNPFYQIGEDIERGYTKVHIRDSCRHVDSSLKQLIILYDTVNTFATALAETIFADSITNPDTFKLEWLYDSSWYWWKVIAIDSCNTDTAAWSDWFPYDSVIMKGGNLTQTLTAVHKTQASFYVTNTITGNTARIDSIVWYGSTTNNMPKTRIGVTTGNPKDSILISGLEAGDVYHTRGKAWGGPTTDVVYDISYTSSDTTLLADSGNPRRRRLIQGLGSTNIDSLKEWVFDKVQYIETYIAFNIFKIKLKMT